MSCFRVVYSLLPCGHLKERADFLALVCEVHCDFVTLPFGILGQVWYLIVSIPAVLICLVATSMQVVYPLCSFILLSLLHSITCLRSLIRLCSMLFTLLSLV